MKKNSGFTIVELLVILGLIGIMVVFAAGFFGRAPAQRSKFNSAVNNFIADLNYAKHFAARENRYVQIDFSSNGTSYSLLRQTLIGNYTDWTVLPKKKNVFPLSGVEFFDGAAQPDFAVNSMGEVFTLPINANSQPVSVTLNFYIKYRGTTIDYRRTITIRPYGGISRDK